MLFRIHFVFDAAKSAFRQRSAQLPKRISSESFFEQACKTSAHSLDRFKNDVANKAVRNDDVNPIFKNIASFDVSQKIQIDSLAEPEGFASDFRSFHLLRTIAQNADPWLLAAKHFARVDMAHHCKLQKVQRLAFGCCAAIEQDEFALSGGNHRRDGWSLY